MRQQRNKMGKALLFPVKLNQINHFVLIGTRLG